MNKWRFIFLLAFFLPACKSDIPDVSGIKVHTVIHRFDKDFFAADTTNMEAGLNWLNQKYPDFLPDYLVKILGIDPADPQALPAVKAFIRSYHPVFDTADIVASKALPEAEHQLQDGLRFMKYYFPKWKPDSPFVITTFVGPMDAFEPFPVGDYGDVRTRDGVGIAMQFHLGAKASLYQSGSEAGLFYEYQSRRFTPDMIVINSMKNIIDDAFPYMANGKPLIEEMIEKGKRLYVLDKVLPYSEDSLKLGYTEQQLKGCFENETLIWNFFVKNDLLYTKDGAITQNYIKDGPKTEELGGGAPGYIGLFVGRQIVRNYMEKNAKTPLEELMKKEAKEILEGSGYKP